MCAAAAVPQRQTLVTAGKELWDWKESQFTTKHKAVVCVLRMEHKFGLERGKELCHCTHTPNAF